MPNPFASNKIVFHIDYDSFFASVEQQYNPSLRGKPLGVTGSSLSKGVICAASKEAKKLGIKTAMPVFKALEIYPHLTLVRGDFEKYQYVHKKTLEICNTYTDLVEPFSIDELFMDITSTIHFFGSIEETIFRFKKDIFATFGAYITCSIGVGPNKLLAKLSSDINKPNGSYIVTRKNINQLLKRTLLTDFCGIGKRVEARLSILGVHNITHLQRVNTKVLHNEFGNVMATFLKNLSYGIGSVTVDHCEYRSLPKSIGHQHTLAKNTSDRKVILRNLQRLSSMVGKRLRGKNMVGKTIGLFLRDKDFKNHFERTSLILPTDSTQKIYKTIEKLLIKSKWHKETRLVGVSISGLTLKNQTSLPLFPEDIKGESIHTALDTINDKFGDYTIVPANTLLADQTKGKISSFLKH